MMQASDIAHTMQHGHVYQKWDKIIFEEIMYSVLGIQVMTCS